jgi:hypothetical protein
MNKRIKLLLGVFFVLLSVINISMIANKDNSNIPSTTITKMLPSQPWHDPYRSVQVCSWCGGDGRVYWWCFNVDWSSGCDFQSPCYYGMC